MASFRFPVSALLAVCILACAGASMAQESTIQDYLQMDLEELSNYQVVTPTKTGTKLKDAPGSISVISFEQIQDSAARTIPDLLRLIPGLNVRWNPMVQTIDIRGFGSNPFTSKVLLLIDGIPYNSWNKGGFPQHPGFDFFNIANVKHLEVVRGPGSGLYGENALNGVINIVTLSGEEFRQTSMSVSAGSRDTRAVSVAHGSRIGDDASLFASIRHEQTQLPSGLWSENGGSDARGYDLFVKAKYRDLQLSLYRRDDSFAGFDHDPGVPFLPPGSTFSSAENIEQTVNIAALQYERKSVDEKLSLKANFSYANRDGSHCASCHDPRGPVEGEDHDLSGVEDHGYQAYGVAQVGWEFVENHALLFGVESRKISAGDHTEELDVTSGPDVAVTKYSKSALFVQDEISLPNGRVDLVLGLRYEGATSPTLFGSELFPRMSLVARPTDKLTLRTGWSEAARYPSFTELYQDSAFVAATTPLPAPNDYIPLIGFVPNPGLQPENISSVELGFAYAFSSSLQANLDVFRNEVENSIVVVYGPAGIGFENHPNTATVSGAEFEIKAEPNRQYSMYANISYQKSDQNSAGTDSVGNNIELTYAPKYKVNAGLSYTPLDSLAVNLEASWRDKYDAPAYWYQFVFPTDPTPRPLPSYALIDLSIQYRLPFVVEGSKRPLTLIVRGKNLGNEKPFETLTGFGGRSSAGRELFVSLEYDWTQ